MLELTLNYEMALGNGTRPKGFRLCTIDANGLDEIQAALTAGCNRLDDLPAEIKACAVEDGQPPVIEAEILTALRNPQIVSDAKESQAIRTVAEKPAAAASSNVNKPKLDHWKKTKLDDLNLSNEIRAKLKAAKLKTAGDVDREGEEGRLANLVSPGQMREIAAELERLAAA